MQRTIGRVLGQAEQAFGNVWSIGEMLVMGSRTHEVISDPYRSQILQDIERRGFYPELTTQHLHLKERNGYLRGRNAYRRVIPNPRNDKVVARWKPAAGGQARHLLVVCHCYGVPIPPVMEQLFGLQNLQDVDVAYNIMNHHYWGSFPLWPGTGLVSGRQSQFLENIRSAVTGGRVLIEYLRRRKTYQSVTALGFSIGGQMSLHLANSAPIDKAILYCPVASLHQTAQELGMMRAMQPVLRRWQRAPMARLHLDDMRHASPLDYTLAIQPQNLHVIAQRNDALATLRQVSAIRAKYPQCGWHEFDGTHVVPFGLRQFQRTIADIVHN